MTRSTCRLRAYRYRQRGVPLKELPPGGFCIDWDDLAEFAKEVAARPAKKKGT
jgi:hypothetical protein